MPTRPASMLPSAPPIGVCARSRRRAMSQHVEDLLWQTAMALEQKGLLAAANNLRELQALITAAMAAHAPQEVIDELLQRYNQAMQRYLRRWRQFRRSQQAAAARRSQRQDLGVRRSAEIDAGDPAIVAKRRSRTGGPDAGGAAEHAGKYAHLAQANGQGGNSQQNTELNRAIQKYGDLMGKQRALLDKTLPPATGPGRSQGWRRRRSCPPAAGLAQETGRSRMKRLGPKMGEGPGQGRHRRWTRRRNRWAART